MKIQDGDQLLFIGDSITDCGRQRPVGERAGLGEGYVAFVDAHLALRHPDRLVRVLNMGINGHRVIDLEARWQTDVLDLAPDWLSVMIGINDVWRQFDSPEKEDQTNLKRFETVYRALLEQTRPKLKGLVLMSPYYLEPNRNEPMRIMMDAYGAVVRELAQAFDAIFVDVQTAFDRFLEHRLTQTLCSDRVHPNKTGHMIIADAFLSAMDLA